MKAMPAHASPLDGDDSDDEDFAPVRGVLSPFGSPEPSDSEDSTPVDQRARAREVAALLDSSWGRSVQHLGVMNLFALRGPMPPGAW
jgi:hypothetical protein